MSIEPRAMTCNNVLCRPLGAPSVLISVIHTESTEGGLMRKWGIVITICYALILLGLFLPVFVFYTMGPSTISVFRQDLIEVYQNGVLWLPLGTFISGQALLLFLSVD